MCQHREASYSCSGKKPFFFNLKMFFLLGIKIFLPSLNASDSVFVVLKFPSIHIFVAPFNNNPITLTFNYLKFEL